MADTATQGALSDAQHSRELRKAVIASTVGTTIEWYDFFIYGTAAGLVFPKLRTRRARKHIFRDDFARGPARIGWLPAVA